MQNNNRNQKQLIDAGNKAAIGDYTVSSSKTSDTIAKIICVLMAVVIWFYAVSSTNSSYTHKFETVVVTIENAPAGYTVETTENVLSVSVTVMGRRSDIIEFDSSDIKAVLDLSQFSFDGTSERVAQSFNVKVTLPTSSVAVTAISPASFTLTFVRTGN